MKKASAKKGAAKPKPAARERKQSQSAKAEAKRAEAMKPAPKPSEAAEQKATGPGPGHNSSLTFEQRQKLLLMGIAKIERYTTDIDSLSAKRRNVRKELKSDGFEPYEIDFALRLRKSEDQAEEHTRWRRMQEVAKFLGHPIGTQPDLFDGVDRTPLVDRAYEEGKIAGMEGEVACSPPYDASTEAGQKWISGWHDGQAVILERGIKAPVQAAATGQADAFDDLPDADSESPPPAERRETFGEGLRRANPGIENTPGFKPIAAAEPAEAA